MSELPVPVWVLVVALASMVVFIAFEVRWNRRGRHGVYNLRETLANVVIFIGSQVTKVLFLGWQVFWVDVFARWRFFELEPTTLSGKVLLFGIAFIATDFAYYWMHRCMHENRFLWAFHLVHHSSPWMNLTTSYRLNWLSPVVAIFFYAPLGLFGFSADVIGAALIVNLLYQFWLHTESIGTLGVVEGWLNTPSAHRVHHGRNPEYLDTNYGGVLMVWDRLFGTYVEENAKVIYGVTTGFHGHHPVRLVFHGFVDLVRGQMGRG